MSGTVKWDEAGDAHYFVEGVEVAEEVFRQTFPPQEGAPRGHASSCWPMKSEALACDPSQVAEMNERNAKAGIGTRYDTDGIARIPSREDRRRLLRLEGMHDKQGGYGD